LLKILKSIAIGTRIRKKNTPRTSRDEIVPRISAKRNHIMVRYFRNRDHRIDKIPSISARKRNSLRSGHRRLAATQAVVRIRGTSKFMESSEQGINERGQCASATKHKKKADDQ